MRELARRYGVVLAAVFGGLTAFWLLALVVFPYIFLAEKSFRPYLPVDQVGGPTDLYTLSNYMTFFNSSSTVHFFFFDLPIHVYIFLETVFFSSVVTAVTLALAYPLAYFIAKVAKPQTVPSLFLMLLIPLWVSEILRSFAWYIILSYQGPLNAGLDLLGFHKVRWLTAYNGVIIGLVYTYVLFMLFPVYNAISTLDTNQIEAAEDMGARWWQIHRRVVMPHAKPGIASGCVMVFMLSAGSIIVPSLLASPSSRWFTEVIQQWMFEAQDWNTGSAYAFLLLLICTIFVSLMMRLFKVRLADIAQ
ncbi:MAG TPA: ABC transporter permease [Terriglobia bacterium]|nr:ABC transporter permease [Terriglobia bacterium]